MKRNLLERFGRKCILCTREARLLFPLKKSLIVDVGQVEIQSNVSIHMTNVIRAHLFIGAPQYFCCDTCR